MIVKVKILSSEPVEIYVFRKLYVYRSGGLDVDRLRDAPYVVVPWGRHLKLAKVAEVGRTRRAVGSTYTGKLKTIERFAYGPEIRLAQEIEKARTARERATARLQQKGRTLDNLIRWGEDGMA